MMRKLTFIFIITFLVLIDIGTTSIYIQLHGLSHEQNPIIKYFFIIGGVNYGILLAMIFKSVLSGFCFAYIAIMPSMFKKNHRGKSLRKMVIFAEISQEFVIYCYVFIAINNLYLLLI
jgi:hypothetical protein